MNREEKYKKRLSKNILEEEHYTRKINSDVFSYPALISAHPKIETEISRFLAEKFNHNSSPFDSLIDQNYNLTKIGGSALHHNLDGSHTWDGALQTLREAFPDESNFLLSINAFDHLLRDFTTPSGINPFLSPKNFVQNKSFLMENFDINPSLANDLLNMNAAEVLTSTLGILSLVLANHEEDYRQISKIGSRLATTSFFAGNPVLLGICLLYFSKTLPNADPQDLLAGATEGTLSAGVFLYTASAFPFPLFVSLGLGIIASIAVDWVLKKIIFSDSQAFEEQLQTIFKHHRSYLGKI